MEFLEVAPADGQPVESKERDKVLYLCGKLRKKFKVETYSAAIGYIYHLDCGNELCGKQYIYKIIFSYPLTNHYIAAVIQLPDNPPTSKNHTDYSQIPHSIAFRSLLRFYDLSRRQFSINSSPGHRSVHTPI